MRLNKIHCFPVCIDFDLLDAGQVVYHPNYFVLCERARNASMHAAGYPFVRLWAEGMALALVEAKSSFRRPALLGEKLCVLTHAKKVRRSAIEIEQHLVQLQNEQDGYQNSAESPTQQVIYFELVAHLVCVKMNPVRAVRIPAALKEALTSSD